jgi:site-specific recombinase XerD
VSERKAIERFLTGADLSAATRKAYRVDVVEFASWLHARGAELADVDAELLSAYASELGASVA